MAEVEGKWEMLEEAEKPTLVMGVTHLKFDLLALGKLTEDQAPPRRQLRDQRQYVSYIMGDASGLGIGLVLWGQGKQFFESGEFTPCIKGYRQTFKKGIT